MIPPLTYALSQLIDELVLFDPILCPLRIECKLAGSLFARLCNRNEVGTNSAPFNDFVGDAFIRKSEMAGRLPEWGIENRILDDDLFHLSRIFRDSELRRKKSGRFAFGCLVLSDSLIDSKGMVSNKVSALANLRKDRGKRADKQFTLILGNYIQC